MANVLEIAGAIIVSIGSAGAILLALSSWLGKIWASKILAKDRAKYSAEMERLKNELERASKQVQGEIDKTVFVHRVQFETEFKALTDIWAKVAHVRGEMSHLRPSFTIEPDQTLEDRKKALEPRFKSFWSAYNELIDAVHRSGPFYSRAVREELLVLLGAGQAERNSIRLHFHEVGQGDWYDVGEKNFGDYCASADRVEELVRQRIDRLAVIEGGSG